MFKISQENACSEAAKNSCVDCYLVISEMFGKSGLKESLYSMAHMIIIIIIILIVIIAIIIISSTIVL